MSFTLYEILTHFQVQQEQAMPKPPFSMKEGDWYISAVKIPKRNKLFFSELWEAHEWSEVN